MIACALAVDVSKHRIVEDLRHKGAALIVRIQDAAHRYCQLKRTLRGMDQHLVEKLLEVRIPFVGRVIREDVEQASLKIT